MYTVQCTVYGRSRDRHVDIRIITTVNEEFYRLKSKNMKKESKAAKNQIFKSRILLEGHVRS